MKKTRIFLGLLLVVALMAFAGCSSDGDGTFDPSTPGNVTDNSGNGINNNDVPDNNGTNNGAGDNNLGNDVDRMVDDAGNAVDNAVDDLVSTGDAINNH